MKYFTRELQDLLQGPPDSPKVINAERLWDQRLKEYEDYFERVSSTLPASVLDFADYNLHDAVVSTVTFDSKLPLLEINLKAWPGAVLTRICFEGVSQYELPDSVRGEWWLYEEISQIDSSLFRLDILFSGCEGFVEAKDVRLEILGD